MSDSLAARRAVSEVSYVALFLPNLGGGGAERVMLNLARGFAERGLKVDLVLVKAEGPYLVEVPSDVRVVDLGAKRVLYSLPSLVRYLRRERPAVMLSTLEHVNIVALWARFIAGTPSRLVIRNTNMVGSISSAPTLRARWVPLLMRLFYHWADAVIANSRGMAEELMRHTGLSTEKVKVIYNPVVTPELFAKAGEPLDHPWFAPGEPPVVLGVGRLTRAKDFSTLIRAFALVRGERPARLLILGEGKERPRLEALVRELGLETDVALPGFVENPFKFMKRAAVFVLSSRWEGLPNVLIQALALGTPVISTNCPSGPAEILEGGKWGKLVPINDHKSLAQAILDVLTTPEVTPGAIDRVKDLFSLDVVVNQYLEVLQGK